MPPPRSTGSSVPCWIREEVTRWERLWPAAILAAALAAEALALAAFWAVLDSVAPPVFYAPP